MFIIERKHELVYFDTLIKVSINPSIRNSEMQLNEIQPEKVISYTRTWKFIKST